MDHRHLLPNEFDLLLDGDVGFGVVPLKAHVRSCERCRAELEALREVTTMLDELPRLAPSPQFADAVLAKVHVFQPWHVALLDTIRRLVPRSTPARVLAGAGAAGMVVVFSLVTAAVLLRLDVFLFSASLLLDRVRSGALALGRDLFGTLFGQSTVESLLGPGGGTVAALVLSGVAVLAAAALGLGALAVAARRQRTTR